MAQASAGTCGGCGATNGAGGGAEATRHSALSYVFDTQGRLRLALKHEQTAEDYAHDIALLARQ